MTKGFKIVHSILIATSVVLIVAAIAGPGSSFDSAFIVALNVVLIAFNAWRIRALS